MHRRNTASNLPREADLTGIRPFPRARATASFTRVKPDLSYRFGIVHRLAILMFLLAACGGAASNQTATSEDEGLTASTLAIESPATTSGEDAQTASAPDAPSTTMSDRPLAPDFTLALADGGEFTLSETSKPVYLVFWAEW